MSVLHKLFSYPVRKASFGNRVMLAKMPSISHVEKIRVVSNANGTFAVSFMVKSWDSRINKGGLVSYRENITRAQFETIVAKLQSAGSNFPRETMKRDTLKSGIRTTYTFAK